MCYDRKRKMPVPCPRNWANKKFTKTTQTDVVEEKTVRDKIPIRRPRRFRKPGRGRRPRKLRKLPPLPPIRMGGGDSLPPPPRMEKMPKFKDPDADVKPPPKFA